MNVALIHEKLIIKSFWEQKIENHSQMAGVEEKRLQNSALSKLRDEWLHRLESRTKHLKAFSDERGKRDKPTPQKELE
ncbi:protein FAM240B [Denticeps clupeoides]|uniref:protein FAM240B n=1 Tax=Denticeps clupeoides TaxID=299321 RepID=UPI0010A2BF21|nr:protein FAM240A [Denticeps clupeoides]